MYIYLFPLSRNRAGGGGKREGEGQSINNKPNTFQCPDPGLFKSKHNITNVDVQYNDVDNGHDLTTATLIITWYRHICHCNIHLV